MRIALGLALAALILSGCAAAPKTDVSPTTDALYKAPVPANYAVTKFTDCYGWLLNEEMRFDYAQEMVPIDFTPERAGPRGPIPFPPGGAHDPSNARKILWALRCAKGQVGDQTFTDVGYLYACVPSVPNDPDWQAGYKRHYLAVELGVFPPAMADAINAQTGLTVTPGTLTTGVLNVMGNGIHEWKFKAENWSFTLNRRIQEPTPGYYMYDTEGVTSLWTFDGNVNFRAHRHSHGGYSNERYPSSAQFEGETRAKKMFEPGEEFWMASQVRARAELEGAWAKWIPEGRFVGNQTEF